VSLRVRLPLAVNVPGTNTSTRAAIPPATATMPAAMNAIPRLRRRGRGEGTGCAVHAPGAAAGLAAWSSGSGGWACERVGSSGADMSGVLSSAGTVRNRRCRPNGPCGTPSTRSRRSSPIRYCAQEPITFHGTNWMETSRVRTPATLEVTHSDAMRTMRTPYSAWSLLVQTTTTRQCMPGAPASRLSVVSKLVAPSCSARAT